jgi:hypothetical protein
MAEMPHEKAQNPGEAIYQEARCARETSQELLPLLKLLEADPKEGPSPLDELKGLLTAIVQILAKHGDILTRLGAVSSNALPSPESAASTSAH